MQENALLQSHMRTNVEKLASHAAFRCFRNFFINTSKWQYKVNYMSLDLETICKHISHHLQTLRSILKKSNFHIPKSIFWKYSSIILTQNEAILQTFRFCWCKKFIFSKSKDYSKNLARFFLYGPKLFPASRVCSKNQFQRSLYVLDL